MNGYLPSSRSDYGKHNYGYLLFAPAIHQDPQKKTLVCMILLSISEKRSNILDLLFEPFP